MPTSNCNQELTCENEIAVFGHQELTLTQHIPSDEGREMPRVRYKFYYRYLGFKIPVNPCGCG